MTEFQPMSPSERQIMRVLWANPNSTSGYIIEQLQRSFHGVTRRSKPSLSV